MLVVSGAYDIATIRNSSRLNFLECDSDKAAGFGA